MVADAVEVYSKTSDKPIVTVFNGIEGVKNIYLDTLTIGSDEVIYAFLNPQDVNDEIYNWLDTIYAKKRAQKSIFAHVFITNKNGERAKRYLDSSDGERRKVEYIEDFGKHFQCEVDIYGNKVAFINHNPAGEISGMIIDHPIIANTLKSFYLHFLWKM